MTDLALFFIASLALNLTPGNDMLYVISRSVSYGFKAGLYSSMGIFLGCLVHVMAAVLGNSLLIAQWVIVSCASAVNLPSLVAASLIFCKFLCRNPTELNICCLARANLTGRLTAFAATAAITRLAHCPPFDPKPPPIKGVTMRTFSGFIFSVAAAEPCAPFTI